MTDFLHTKVKEIEERLQELRPLVHEYQRLEAAAAALGGLDGSVSTLRLKRGSAGNRNGSRRGRPRGGNTRATQAVELVRTQPGITIPALADHMGIKPNYLYRILPQLAKEGKVRRAPDKGWHPA